MSLIRPEPTDGGGLREREALLGGDPDALDRWYREQWPPVYRLALGVLGQVSEAQDLAQEAMMHLSDHLNDYDPARSWVAWRNRVVANLGRDRLRRLEARARAELDARETRSAPMLPDPRDSAAAAEVQQLLLEALRTLTPREREVFVLRELEDRPGPEVAEALGIQPTTVRTLLALARRRLRHLLGPRLTASSSEGHPGSERDG